MPAHGRNFALTFGHVAHFLKDESYEFDFGLKVTLNCVDPEKLKNIDAHEPGLDRHRRTQTPIGSDLTYFDFDNDTTILKSLTGHVKEEYCALFRTSTGTKSLRVSLSIASDDIIGLLVKLLQIYEKNDYLQSFPNVRNISPVHDPEILHQLYGKLISAIRSDRENLLLSVPDLVDYESIVHFRYIGFGHRKHHDFENVYLNDYFQELKRCQVKVEEIELSDLKKHVLQLRDDNGSVVGKYSILKSLIFDTTLDQNSDSFHYADGNWYQVEQDFISNLNTEVDNYKVTLNLPPFKQATEYDYNQSVATAIPHFICLDRKLIQIRGESSFELCDLCSMQNDEVKFVHVKRSTRSAGLSHLFNQGVNSIQLTLHIGKPVLDQVRNLVSTQLSDDDVNKILRAVKERSVKVIFGIVTSRNQSAISANLPLFSRVSLRQAMRTLDLLGIEARYGFINNDSDDS